MKNNQHSLIGKIARLPKSIREKLNRRLEDGQPASEILPWLNALPRVQKILAAQFAGAPIKAQNLSNWRASTVLRAGRKTAPPARLAELGEDATDISRRRRGRLARGAAAIAAAQILEFLKSIPPKNAPLATPPKSPLPSPPSSMPTKTTSALGSRKRNVQQKDEQLFLMRDKHQRDVAAIAFASFTTNASISSNPPPATMTKKSNSLAATSLATFGNPASSPPRPNQQYP